MQFFLASRNRLHPSRTWSTSGHLQENSILSEFCHLNTPPPFTDHRTANRTNLARFRRWSRAGLRRTGFPRGPAPRSPTRRSPPARRLRSRAARTPGAASDETQSARATTDRYYKSNIWHYLRNEQLLLHVFARLSTSKTERI